MKTYKKEFDYRYKDLDEYYALWIRKKPLGEKICDCVGNEAGRERKDYLKSGAISTERFTGTNISNLTGKDLLKSDKYWNQRLETLVKRMMNGLTLTEVQARSLANCVMSEISK